MSKNHDLAITMEGQHEKKVVDQNIVTALEANGKLAPIYKTLKKSMAEAKELTKEDAKKADDGRKKQKPKIQRVPIALKEQTKIEKHYERQWIEQKKLEKYYEPRWISVGPIHHGKKRLMLAENEYKPKLVAKFLKDSGWEIEALYKVIKDKVEVLKECFDKDVINGYDDDSLSWMLFFDGCSTLQFISSYVKSDHELTQFLIKNEQIAFAQQDLFLLENQIPFLVLKLLMERYEGTQKMEDSVKEFIRYNVMTPNKYRSDLKIAIPTDPEPTHLLELLRLAILQQPESHRTCCAGLVGMPCRLLNKVTDFLSEYYKKLFKESKGKGQQSFRSVQDLQSAGIDIKPSETCSLLDITFSSLCFAGRLRLPPITVDDSTGSRFLNLIAFEMCPDNFRTNYEVTSYICFLDSLIDYPSDVKELRSSHIIQNLLGCDKDVALLFNEIGTDLVPSPVVLKDVINQIQNHYRSKWRTSMAEVYHDHFRSPWTLVAFLAAAVALGMSGIQTWYTVNSPS